jgi:pimeloyl-ACP methyl ester carboxylesterase
MRCQLSADRVMTYAEQGQGKPLVWLHGFPMCQELWQPQLQALSDHYRILAPDLTGFGGTSGFPGTPSVGQMADDVAAFLTALKITEPVVLGGLSMGGYVALAFARQHASRLRGLILADTRAEPDGAEAKAGREKMIALAREQGGTAVVEQMLPKLLGPRATKDRPDLAASLRRMAAAQPREGLAGALQAMRDRPDAIPGLSDIRVPTLVIVGSDDQITPPSAAQTLAQKIAGAKLVTLPDAGHVSNLEQTEAFNAAVRSFIAGMGG